MTAQNQRKIAIIITVSVVTVFVILLIALTVNLVQLANVNSRKAELEAQDAKLAQMIKDNELAMNEHQTAAWIEQYARDYLNMIGGDEIYIQVKP